MGSTRNASLTLMTVDTEGFPSPFAHLVKVTLEMPVLRCKKAIVRSFIANTTLKLVALLIVSILFAVVISVYKLA